MQIVCDHPKDKMTQEEIESNLKSHQNKTVLPKYCNNEISLRIENANDKIEKLNSIEEDHLKGSYRFLRISKGRDHRKLVEKKVQELENMKRKYLVLMAFFKTVFWKKYCRFNIIH